MEDTYGGRGIWISGPRGVSVRGNVVRRSSLAGIVVAQSTDPYAIGDFGPPSHDITIQNNSLESDLGPAANGGGAQCALAAIQIVSTDRQQFSFSAYAANTNISILNNTILGAGRSAIWVGELAGGMIQGNVVLGWNQRPELPIWGIPPAFQSQVISDFASPIVVRYSTGVVNQGNAIVHSADSDRNFRINLLELTRGIELFNTRHEGTRTGCYAVATVTTEDGFSADPARAGTVTAMLARYHSADSNLDGKLSLVELTRVIELYNFRSGSTRTGQYHQQTTPPTEDGFAPGP